MAFGGLLSHSRIASEETATRVRYRWFVRGVRGFDDIACRGALGNEDGSNPGGRDPSWG